MLVLPLLSPVPSTKLKRRCHSHGMVGVAEGFNSCKTPSDLLFNYHLLLIFLLYTVDA